ncbi:AP2 domain transcription factor AP2VIII-5 [Toxoplasma gondii GAB2-2007-GAL-DOM2]|uniref:AP2 domain transcription factor AP2VIII-5 n=8 Tax=Toxoplasma gondii TaxID=5811 RepID=B9PI45_TOXGV|nr:AP2 domain transcription factor AP2VIII-5 [Toxoplasma gondii GT1]ESS36177.1 AP2 domain transcription factor AP2VIII-5 [Toxoplasma gondii VEG]KAF4642209.1 AP2 domain transcription factor AP2VIII-5 [Toxoplasma gondii]KFG43481.1 AP2 domain transcription factor AP2VIII-5 [Toxoplasma gondii GAB2-2007-GAL-DOM2]KFG52025.1 AP2 domain transcription factor AP2VIII-5 [Toxoplasma gondii p89]KFG54284.1 AP2 domain transcription factor AP2VIII-5 [Toxoplasma gondii FOU]PUA92189.1 AP2 domain transcription 
MNEVHDVQPGHIYQPGNKKEVRLVYRILSGPYCGRHQKSFSLTKWGVAGAWDAAQQAKAYMLQTGRLPPSFASPYSRSKLTNASANAIVKPVRPPGVPGVDGFLGPMDLDGGATALFPSLAAFSATTKPPDAALGNSLHTCTQSHRFHCEEKNYTESPTTSELLDKALRCCLVEEHKSMPTAHKSRQKRANNAAQSPERKLRRRQHSGGTSSSTASAPLSPLGIGSEHPGSAGLDTLHSDSAAAVAAQLLSPILASLCKLDSRVESDDANTNVPSRRSGSMSPYEAAKDPDTKLPATRPSSGAKGRVSKHTGKDWNTSDTEETVASAGSNTLRKLLSPASLRVSSPGIAAFSEGAGAPFPFLPSPQTGYQRAAPGWAYPPAVQATLEASARVSGPSAPCFQGQQGPAGGPSVPSCGGAMPADLVNLQMLSGTVPHFAGTLQGEGSGAPWVESPPVHPVSGNGGTEGNVSPATAAATALTLLQLAEQNAALQPKDQSQIEPNALQKFLLLQQFQLLQEKQQASQERMCRKSGEPPRLDNQGSCEENGLATASRSTHVSAADLSEVHHSEESSLACANECGRPRLTHKEMRSASLHEADDGNSSILKCVSPDEDGDGAGLELPQRGGGNFLSPLLPQGPRGDLQGQTQNEDIDAVNMSDTLRNLLLAASLQRQQELLGAPVSQPCGGEGSIAHAPEHSETFFNIRSLASLLPQQSSLGKPEQKGVSDCRGNPTESGVPCPFEAVQERETHGVPSHVAMLWGVSSLELTRKKVNGRAPIGGSPAVSLEEAGPLSVASEPTTTSLNSLPDNLTLGRDSLLADSDREDGAVDCSTRTSGDTSDHPSAMKLMSPVSLPGHPSPFRGPQNSDTLCIASDCDTAPCDLGDSIPNGRDNEENAASGVVTRNRGHGSPRNPPLGHLHEQIRPNGLESHEGLRRVVPATGNHTGLLGDLVSARMGETCLDDVQQEDPETAAMALLEAQGCLSGRGGESRVPFRLHQMPKNSRGDILDDRDRGGRDPRKRKGRPESAGEI